MVTRCLVKVVNIYCKLTPLLTLSPRHGSPRHLCTLVVQEELTRAEAALTILNEAEQAVAQQKAELQAIRESQDFAQIIKERDEAKASVIRLEKETETIAGFLADTKQELQKLHADKHVVDQLLQATHLDNDEKAQSLLKMTEAVDSAEQSYNQASSPLAMCLWCGEPAQCMVTWYRLTL